MLKKLGSQGTCGNSKSAPLDEILDKNHGGKKFEQVLLGSIDEAFSTLGERAKMSIYLTLEHKFTITKQDIPCRVDDFSDALERIFGSGARYLEVLIMKKLHEKVGCLYEWDATKWLVSNLTFRKYVELMRLCYEDKGKIGEVEVLIDSGEQKEQFT
jgi:hypothetical protein